MNLLKMNRLVCVVGLLLVGRATPGISGEVPAKPSTAEQESLQGMILDDSADFAARIEGLDQYIRRTLGHGTEWLFKQIDAFPAGASRYQVVEWSRVPGAVFVDLSKYPVRMETTADGSKVLVFPRPEDFPPVLTRSTIELEILRATGSIGMKDVCQVLVGLSADREMPFEIRAEAASQARMMLECALGEPKRQYVRAGLNLGDDEIDAMLDILARTRYSCSTTNRRV